MVPVAEDRNELVEAARRVYEEQLKARLEAEHLGQVIALDPVTGNYVLGQDFAEVDAARRAQLGNRPVYVFRIGGGGAVKIGGVSRRGRISG
jgi:hypothetical protein